MPGCRCRQSGRCHQGHRQDAERAASEGRESGFRMVVDDVNAISRGRLVGRPG
ncbi:MAG: hypothetical protein ABR612_12440 [Chromatocurvus sp.]